MGDSSVFSTRTQVVTDAVILESSFCSDSLRLALEWGEGGLYFSGMPEALGLNPSARRNSGEGAQRERQREKGKKRGGGNLG